MKIRIGLPLAAAVLLGIGAGQASACGYCVEDKVAAVYDHGVVKKAIEQKHVVVFFAIEGPAGSDAAARASVEASIAAAVRTVPGLDRASVRVSLEAGALALSFDARRTTYGAMEKSLDRKLAPLGLALFPLRTLDSPGDLAVATRRTR